MIAEQGSIVNQPAHLIDVLPTLAEIANCEVPETWPNRELRPVSGVSLKPIFDGESLESRPPIHLLFSNDRGLRDGDWKLVSFRREAWELYNMAEDRAELNNLAATEPQRLEAMIQTWTDMTKNVLHASPRSYASPTEAKLPHRHPEWTNFESAKPDDDTNSPRRNREKHAIRARKNTRLTIKDGNLELNFTGDDPGIAMDHRGQRLPAGSYRLTFRLLGGSKGGGEVFYTTDPKITLPKGQRIPFDVRADNQWQDIEIQLPAKQSLQQIRIDVSSGTGQATIADLELQSDNGKRIIAWPEQEK